MRHIEQNFTLEKHGEGEGYRKYYRKIQRVVFEKILSELFR
jgi:uncharacterized protein YhfF